MKTVGTFRTWVQAVATLRPIRQILPALIVLSVMLQEAAPAFGNEASEPAGKSDTARLINTLPSASQEQLRALSATYLVDPGGDLDIKDIQQQPFVTAAREGRFPVPSEGAVWLRFDISNPHADVKRWIIAAIELFVHELALYEVTPEGVLLLSRNGRSVPLNERPINVVQPAVPVQINAGDTRTFYLRVFGMLSPSVSPVLVSADMFTSWSTKSGITIALLAVFPGIMAAFSLIFFRQVDPRSYQYYAAYMMSRFIFAVFYSDWFVQVSGVILSPTVNTRLVQFFSGTGTLFLILFCSVLLSAKGTSKLEKRTIQLLLIAGVAVVAATTLSPLLLRTPLFVFNVAAPLVLFVLAAIKFRAGLHYAGWICVGLAALMVGMFFAILGFLFPNEITPTSSIWELSLMSPLKLGYHFAVLSEPVFMMIALSTMVSSMQRQRRRAIAQAGALQQKMKAAEKERGEMQKHADARIKALEARLVDSPANELLAPVEQRFLERATECVLDNITDESFGVRELALALATSEKTLGRRIQNSHGQTSLAFIRSIRLSFARDLILTRQHRTIRQTSHAAGFSSVSHFTKLYRQEYSETPSETYKLVLPDALSKKSNF
ncbi:7TM-DISM domain-containing protein [Roseobacter sp. MH60115]|uniref:7TM-DISM domain-containing protein n=1 Tax=Roseobacter sp. MH60115 TaxID=2785324 RepID=UPI0018A255C6|nr:7TM-DISM domain-containing protein [Roseobacter sp. MH60115]